MAKENLEITSKKLVRDKNGRLLAGQESLNPKGKPVGSLDFKTKWRIFIDKVAKQNDMTHDEIDEQLLAVGFKKAKEGDYRFYRDIHDRMYGKPVNLLDVTSNGENINQVDNSKLSALAQQINELQRTGGVRGDGITSEPMDTEAPNQE